MTVVDLARDTTRDSDLRQQARQAWYESGGTLTGKQLGERFGKSPRWGQDQRRAAEKERGNLTVVPRVPVVPGVPAAPVPRKAKAAATPAVSVHVRVVRLAAAGLVAAVGAVVSYVHTRHLAEVAGMGNVSGWLPLGIDGMVVACSCTLAVDRRRGKAGWSVARWGAVAGIAGTLALNVVAVDPSLLSLRAVRWVFAIYPPLALAVCWHLLFRAER